MSKRRSIDAGIGCQEEPFLPAKRIASSSCASIHDPASGPAAAASPFLPEACGSVEAVQVWLAVAAQVQDALASLPGWIHITQTANVEHQELPSSLSSACTPLAVAATVNHPQCPSDFRSQQHNAAARACSVNVLPRAPSSIAPSRAASGPSAPPFAPAAPPSTAVEMPAPAQAPHAAAAAMAPDSCTSDTDSAASLGWFSKCRGCCQLTAGEMELQGEVVPMCRGCSSALLRRQPAEREYLIQRVMRAHAKLCQREAGLPA